MVVKFLTIQDWTYLGRGKGLSHYFSNSSQISFDRKKQSEVYHIGLVNQESVMVVWFCMWPLGCFVSSSVGPSVRPDFRIEY